MSLTITIPGAVNVTTGSFAPAVLTIGVGVPGAQGPQGPAGPGVPAGGSAGQFLTKINGTDYNTDWTTVNFSAYAVKANNLSDLTSASTARTNLGLGTMSTATAADYSTTTVANGLYYPLTGNPSSFLTASALTGYATQSFVASNYAPIAAGLPTGGTVGQVLTKNSGTDYDDSWATLIPGDRYLTSSTTSLTINNANKTLTIGTGLSYTTQQDIVIAHDAANHMHARVLTYNPSTGVMDVDVLTHSGSGTFATWTVNVGGTPALTSVVWGDITGTLGNQTDLASALGNKLETSTAASTYAALAGATFTGEVITPASTTSNAGLTITPGVAPTTPTNGEIWATTNDLQVRLNGVTETVAEQSWVTAGFYPLSGNPSSFLVAADITGKANLSGATFTGLVGTVASTTTTAGLRIPHGSAPTTPTNGDVWTTTSGLFMRQNGSTQQYVDFGGTQTISGSKTFSNANQTLGNSTAAGTINIGTGATISGSTKTISIGNNGASGSTTNVNIANTIGAPSGVATINIGVASGPPTTTTNLNGTVNATTAAADTNSTVVATTAYVVGQAGSATPLVNGTAAVGTSLRYARQDHVHGTDTTRAPLASPTFTGTPLSTTAAADTNTTQIATTAYVVGQAAAATPLVDGTAAVGTSLRYARADHVHPTDTSRAALNSPAFTGTPSLPTGTTAVTQTPGNNTTAVATTAFVTAAVPAAATHLASVQFASTSFSTVLDNSSQRIAPSFYRVWPSPSNYNGTSTSGAGASAGAGLSGPQLTSPSAGVAGSARVFFGNIAGDLGYIMWGGASASQMNFSRRVSMAFRFSQFPSDNNSVTRVVLGKTHGTAVGDLTARGIGVKYVVTAGVGNFNLQVHNGTTLTNIPGGNYAGGVADLEVVSDGAGNAVLYLNGVSVATTNAAPTGSTGANATVFAEVESQATTTAQPVAAIGRLTVNTLNF